MSIKVLFSTKSINKCIHGSAILEEVWRYPPPDNQSTPYAIP
jgi:hypothetical protein